MLNVATIDVVDAYRTWQRRIVRQMTNFQQGPDGLLVKCLVEAQSADFATANDRKRLSINPSGDQNLPAQFCKASLQTKCLVRIHCDVVFRSYTPNSRWMDAGNSAFAGLYNLVGKMNLFSSFQMSKEMLALRRRKYL